MINTNITYGEEEKEALIKISMDSESTRKSARRISTFCIILAAIFMLDTIFGGALYMVIFAVIALLISRRGVDIILKNTIKGEYKKMDEKVFTVERHMEIDEEGMKISSDLGDSEYKWSGFKDGGTVSHYNWIKWADDGKLVLIDRAKLSDEETAELDSYMEKVAATNNIQ